MANDLGIGIAAKFFQERRCVTNFFQEFPLYRHITTFPRFNVSPKQCPTTRVKNSRDIISQLQKKLSVLVENCDRNLASMVNVHKQL
jgi:hypothetical protein